MSAPFRYARILKGLSFLISSRSATSRRIRAIARLSNPQTFHLDTVLEESGAAFDQRADDGRACFGWTITEQAPAPPGAAHFGGRRSGLTCSCDQLIDRRR